MSTPLRFRWERLIRDSDLGGTTKFVALMLATYGNSQGRQIHPGEARLVADTGLGLRTVRQHLTILRKAGLIQRLAKGRANQFSRTADLYALALAPVATGSRAPLPDAPPEPVVPADEDTRYRQPPAGTEKPVPADDDAGTGTVTTLVPAATAPPSSQRPTQETPECPAPDDAAPSAQTLVGEWIDHCAVRPPGRVVGQVAREVRALLDEDQPYALVRDALAEWNRKGLHPSTLPSVVHEIANRDRRPARQQASDDMFARALERARERERNQG